MMNFILLLNILSALSMAPNDRAISFESFLEHGSESDIQFLQSNGIDDWEDYADYLSSPLYVSTNEKGDDESGSVSDRIYT